MKQFHISDVLSVTTGRLVSNRHITGVYDVLNFLTGDNLFTHQLGRAFDECKPWIKTQFPQLFPESEAMEGFLKQLTSRIAAVDEGEDRWPTISEWVEEVRHHFGLPEMLPIYEMPEEMHTHIDPHEEAAAMMGDKNVIGVEVDDERASGAGG